LPSLAATAKKHHTVDSASNWRYIDAAVDYKKLSIVAIHAQPDWLQYWLLGEENPHPMDKDEYVRWAKLRKKLDALKSQSASTN
jgi:hypothetical protein